MNVQEYKQAGYNVSQQIDQSNVDLAEKDAFEAYVQPLGAKKDDIQGEDVRAAVMCLANLLILQRSTFATRAGAKDKASQQSISAERWTLLEQWAQPCKQKLEVVAKRLGVKHEWRKVNDICGIYYGKHFIGI